MSLRFDSGCAGDPARRSATPPGGACWHTSHTCTFAPVPVDTTLIVLYILGRELVDHPSLFSLSRDVLEADSPTRTTFCITRTDTKDSQQPAVSVPSTGHPDQGGESFISFSLVLFCFVGLLLSLTRCLIRNDSSSLSRREVLDSVTRDVIPPPIHYVSYLSVGRHQVQRPCTTSYILPSMSDTATATWPWTRHTVTAVATHVCTLCTCSAASSAPSSTMMVCRTILF